jgi:hypothetical protein
LESCVLGRCSRKWHTVRGQPLPVRRSWGGETPQSCTNVWDSRGRHAGRAVGQMQRDPQRPLPMVKEHPQKWPQDADPASLRSNVGPQVWALPVKSFWLSTMSLGPHIPPEEFMSLPMSRCTQGCTGCTGPQMRPIPEKEELDGSASRRLPARGQDAVKRLGSGAVLLVKVC